jgi:serine/threonine-protein kinase
MPTAVNTPTPTATSPPEAKIETTLVTSQTRAIDDAVEVLVQSAEDQANWFWIDRTEVTNRQYQACVQTGACPENARGYAGLFYEANHPVVGVDWAQAQDYCQWVGGNLPTVSQWRAAASPDGRVYPWGDTGPTCEVAVINDACDTEEPGTRPVGSKPEGASPFGVLDLVGNVWEWTTTLGNKDDARVTLGGSWSNPDRTPQGGFEAFNPANTLSQDEPLQASNLGFRCVRVYESASTRK